MTTKSDDLSWEPYSIPLDEAQARVTNWIEGPDMAPKKMRAFVVHREDFVELLAQQSTEFIRMYIGRKADEVTGELNPCLMLVSAAKQKDIEPNPEYPDMIEDLTGEMTIYVDGKPTTQNYEIFDFTHTCPPHCGLNSPLLIDGADENCM